MPQRQPKAAIARAENKLLRHYANAWQQVVDLQEAIANDPRQWRKARKLREAQRAIEVALDQLDAFALEWFARDYPQVYAMGVNASIRELGASSSLVWSAINSEAVELLAAQGFDDMLKATKLVRRTTKTMIRSILQDVVLQKMIAGDTAVAAARRARLLIEKRGVYAVRYANGSRHGLREYANMAVRTKTAVGYNVGTLDAATSQGITYWEVFDGICGWTYHDDTTANGKIVTRDEALAYPIAHPNCRRAFGARPDLSSPMPAPKPVEPQVLTPTAEARERVRANAEKAVSARARR